MGNEPIICRVYSNTAHALRLPLTLLSSETQQAMPLEFKGKWEMIINVLRLLLCTVYSLKTEKKNKIIVPEKVPPA